MVRLRKATPAGGQPPWRWLPAPVGFPAGREPMPAPPQGPRRYDDGRGHPVRPARQRTPVQALGK